MDTDRAINDIMTRSNVASRDLKSLQNNLKQLESQVSLINDKFEKQRENV